MNHELKKLFKRGASFLGVRFPIMGGAMTWLSERNLVSAISNAGGFGVIACGSMNAKQLEQEIIEVVKYRKNLESLEPISGFGEIEKNLVTFTRELVSEEKISSETFASSLELFGNEGLVDIVGLIGYYNLVAMTLKAFDVQRPIGTELLLPISEN